MSKEYKITVIDYLTGYYFEKFATFDSDYDEDSIVDEVMINVGVELELISDDSEEDE